jgi:single-strand DNA-binding protein
MSGVNKVTLIGRLGKDPDVRFFRKQHSFSAFPLATSEYYLDKQGQKQERTEWHNIAVWRKLAESAQKYLQKES